MAEKQETVNKPGYYDSPLEDFPGFIQFPYPVTLPQFRGWWQTAVQNAEDLSLTDYALFECEWEAARSLLLDYGRVQLEGVTPGEMRDGQIHLGLAAWIIKSASEFMYPFLPPKQRVVWSTFSSQVARRMVSPGS